MPIPELLIALYNFGFFLIGVPICLWINNKTKNDIVCVILGLIYMVLYGFITQPPLDEWFFFFFGLIVGYVTDYWGVKTKKWKYHPWDPEYGYSGYVGFAWGMVTMFTYNIGKAIPSSPLAIIVSSLVFVLPMIAFEWKYGETRKDQYFLFARVFFTFLAFYNNLGLLFVAIFVGSYIEWIGVYVLKNWLYIDTMSFIFLSGGYSLLILTSKMLVDIIFAVPIDIFSVIFFIVAIAFYIIDTFYVQKQVVDKYNLSTSDKAIKAAEKFNNGK